VFFDGASVAASPAGLAQVYTELRSTVAADQRTHDLSPLTAAAAIVFILAGIVLPGVWFGKVT
jgi:hypothetical protein